MRRCRSLAALVFVFSLFPLGAVAQSAGKVAVGGKVSVKGSSGEDSRGGTSLGLLWRFGRGKEGWGFRYGLSWYSAHLNTTIGDSRSQEFCELKLRPFMAGYGYARNLGRTRISGNVLAGFALTAFSLTSSADQAFRTDLAAVSVDADSSTPLVIKPEVTAWFDLNRKVGLNISAGYMIAHPNVTIVSPQGIQRRRVDADMFVLSVGAVYSVF